MPDSPLLPVEIVNRYSQLEKAAGAMLNSPLIALDTESNSFHRYPEQLCLIQVATRDRIFIIDTIELSELGALGQVLADTGLIKIIHGADYDIRSLDRHQGILIRNLYDTNIAARFCGLEQVGLAALAEDLLDVKIPKSKRLQRADWGRRPLSAESLDYAASDVRYLFALKEKLDQRLDGLGRTNWVAEENRRLEVVKYKVPDLENNYISIKGANTLDSRGLAIIRSLSLFREEEARRQHRPPFFVIPDTALVSLAASPETPLSQVPGLREAGLQRFGRGLQQALRAGLSAPRVFRPAVVKEVFSREQIRRLSQLKAWRTEQASVFKLDPALLWPTTSLERLAKAPGKAETEFTSPDIRLWQRERFEAGLRTVLKSKN